MEEIRRIAPNISERFALFRPLICDPPLCSYDALKTTLTIDDLADMLEALDVRNHLMERAHRTVGRKHGNTGNRR